MATLQILTIIFLLIIVILSVIVGTRAHQKEKEATARRFKQMQLANRAERVEHHIKGLTDINTDNIASDVLYDFYLDTLRELLQYADDPERVEVMIAKAEEARDSETRIFNPEAEALSFQAKANYKERLTKVAKMLLFLRRKGRISNNHYQECYDYLRWLNLWIQLNRQLIQANSNFNGGDSRVAQTLYGVILSHLKADSIERPEKKALRDFVETRIKQLIAPSLEAAQDAENPDEAIVELLQNLDSGVDTSTINNSEK